MGTRSLTFIYANDKTTKAGRACCMYRQCDGYPSGHGTELAEFLAGGDMVNGITPGSRNIFNGMTCLAAQMVAHFKDGPGHIYLYPTNTADAWQDYEYHVYFVGGKFNIVVKDPTDEIFKGSLDEFAAFCKEN